MITLLPTTEAEWASAHERYEARRAVENQQAEFRGELDGLLTRKLHTYITDEMRHRHYSDATLKAYRSDFKIFETYASQLGLSARPACPELVAAFVVARSEDGHKVLTRALAAISAAHRCAELSDPTKDLLVAAALRWAQESNEPPEDEPPPSDDTALNDGPKNDE